MLLIRTHNCLFLNKLAQLYNGNITDFQYKMVILPNSMIIKLKNFKCWANSEFEFKDNDTILMSGVSGTGKSSILQAINFALTGKGNKLIKHGSTSCKVELIYQDTYITRTKRPNRLTVNDMEDEVAQEYIYKVFGKKFETVSYIEQNSTSTLLAMTPSQRLEFLESIAFENSDIAALKTRIKEETSKCSQEIKVLENSVSLLVSHRDSISIDSNIIPPSTVISKEQLDMHISTIKEYECKVSDLKAKKILAEQLQTKKNNALERLSVVDSELAETNTKLSHCEYIGDTKFSELCNTYDSAVKYQEYLKLKNSRDSLEELVNTIRTNEKNQYDELYHELNSKLWSQDAKQSTLNKIRSLRDVNNKNIKYRELESKMQTLEPLYTKYNTIVNQYGTTTSCPSCKTSLNYIHGRLCFPKSKTSNENIDDLKKRHDEYLVLKDQLCAVQYQQINDNELTELEDLVSINIELENKLQALGQYVDSHTLVDLKSRLNTISMKLLSLKITEEEPQDISQIMDTYTTQIKLKSEYGSLTSQLNKLNTEKRYLDRLIESISIDGSAIVDYNNAVTLLENMQQEYYAMNQQYMKTQEYNMYIQQRERYDTLNNQAIETQSLIGKIERRTALLLKLEEHVRHSESKCLDTLVNNINLHSQEIIDRFFDQKLVSKLTTMKEVKGKIKPCINISIEYNGDEVDGSELSGGEFARLALAYTLALSQIYKSKFIILDETISSLDETNTETVIDTINETMSGQTVIIVSHQANAGLFDSVLNI